MYSTTAVQQGSDEACWKGSKKLAESWAKRVAVKVSDIDVSYYNDPAVPDFPYAMVPFKQDPRFVSLDVKTQRQVLAGAWITYNEKVISIESHIVNPSCERILQGGICGVNNADIKRVVCQTMVDEQYHTLMSLEASLLTRKLHGLEKLVIPESELIQSLKHKLAEAKERPHQDLILLAHATVAELTINAYLKLLSFDDTIQPFNRDITRLHFDDESTHRKIFLEIVPIIYQTLSVQDKAFFFESLKDCLDAFTRPDFSSWTAILSYLEVPEYRDILEKVSQNAKPLFRDYSSFKALLSKLGIEHSELEIDACE